MFHGEPMLTLLKVENFAVVAKAQLELSPGLNVFTGETGAGKSILIDALSMLLKRRKNPSAIRDGADRLSVEALFEDSGKEYVLRREVGRKKSLCFIDGSMVPFDRLQEMATRLINIYGQNEHVFLLNPVNHALFLDQFAKNEDAMAALAKSAAQVREARESLDRMERRKTDVAERLDFLDFRISELEELELEPGLDESLEKEARILAAAEEITTRSARLMEGLYEGENSLYGQASSSLDDLKFLDSLYPDLSPFLREIEGLTNLIPELSNRLSSLQGQVEYDEKELNRLEDKLLRINRLKSKYETDMAGLLLRMDELKRERDRLIHMDVTMRDARKQVDVAFNAYLADLEILRERRRIRAVELGNVMEKELERLELQQSRFEVRIREEIPDPGNASPRGPDGVEFHFSSNPGQAPAPVRDVASGGELSRLMLALKSMNNESRTSTSIFDEIDTGIGGKTAEFVGEKLKRISLNSQVLCISHLPQIAAFADRHILIEKSFSGGRTFSSSRILNEEERVREIARLMAGSAVNEDVLRAARNLLYRRKS